MIVCGWIDASRGEFAQLENVLIIALVADVVGV